MNDEDHVVNVRILEHTYSIKCPPNEAKELLEAARHLDDQMRKIKQSGAITNTDRIAVVAALNLCYELRNFKKIFNSVTLKIKNSLATQEEIAV